MKSVINKFRTLLEKEYEIPLPKRGLKKPQPPKQPAPVQRPGYVNPFKHQQELHKPVSRAPIAPVKNVEPTKPIEPPKVVISHIPEAKPKPHATPTAPSQIKRWKLPKKPAFFDKKIEITIQKPAFLTKKPIQHKPADTQPISPPISIKTKPKVSEAQVPIISVPEVKPQEVKLPEVEPPAIVPVATPKSVVTPEPVKKPEIKMPSITFKKPNVHLPKFSNLRIHRKLTKKHAFTFAIVTAGILVFGVSSFGVPMPFQAEKPKAETAKAEDEAPPAVKLAEAVGKQTKLPTDEEPVSATVSDVEKLRDQEFFKKAQNGDKILMYKVNKKAYLYRPSTEKVLAIAPLNFQDVAGTATESADVTEETPEADAPIEPASPQPISGKVLVPARY